MAEEREAPRRLMVDEGSRWFDTSGMVEKVFPSRLSHVRRYALECIKDMPERYKESNLLEQQLSELIKNAIKHGNRCDPAKKVRVWFRADTERRFVHFIIEDEGEGFQDLERWNEFVARREEAIRRGDLDEMMRYVSYRSERSEESDGGNALFAALEYWNGGIVFNGRRNKVSVVRYF